MNVMLVVARSRKTAEGNSDSATAPNRYRNTDLHHAALLQQHMFWTMSWGNRYNSLIIFPSFVRHGTWR